MFSYDDKVPIFNILNFFNRSTPFGSLHGTLQSFRHRLFAVQTSSPPLLLPKFPMFQTTVQYYETDDERWERGEYDDFLPMDCCTTIFLCNHQLNHISTQPYITLVLVQLDMKITLHTTPPRPTPPIEGQCQQYLSCYWPDFKETVNVGSWKHLEQIPKVTVTFVQTTIVQVTFVHIRNISAVTDPILMKL